MIEISPEAITIMMASVILIGVLTGYPLGIVLGAAAIIFGYITWEGQVFSLLYQRIFGFVMLNYVLLAVPLFIFMGLITVVLNGIVRNLHQKYGNRRF